MKLRVIGLPSLILVTLLTLACADTEPGIEVPVSIHVAALEGPVSTSAGDIVLTDARLTLFSLELVRCESRQPATGGYAFSALAPPNWGELLIPSAHAHVEGSPLIVGTTVVAQSGIVLEHYDRFAPPPGAYCGVRLNLIAADDDAEGSMDPRMQGATIFASGELRDGDAVSQFELVTGASFDAFVEFLPPLELKSPEDGVELVVEVDPTRWFEDLNLRSCERPEHRILEGAGQSLDVRVVR